MGILDVRYTDKGLCAVEFGDDELELRSASNSRCQSVSSVTIESRS